MRALALAVVFSAVMVMAQQPQQSEENAPKPAKREGVVVVPAGTHVALKLTQAISTKNARVGDGVYAQTTFPVTADDKMIIPAGTYVQGRITNVKRAGRVKGAAELQIHFTTLIYPNGYTVMLPGALENAPGLESGTVSDKEGKIQGEGKGGKVASKTAEYGATGAIVGGLAGRSVKGAGIGGGIGAAAGLAVATLTRNTEVRMEPGTTLEMVLQRPLELNEAKIQK